MKTKTPEPSLAVEHDHPTPEQARVRKALFNKAVRQSRTKILLTPNHLSSVLRHNGTTATDALDQLAWEQVLFDVRAASTLKKRAGRGGDALATGIRNARREGVVPIGLLNYAYEEVSRKTRARAMRLVLDGQHAEAAKVDVALHERRAFAASALLEPRFDIFTRREPVHLGLEVKFALDESLYFSNLGTAPSRFRLDFGDGEGARELAWGEVATVHYDEPGRKTVTLEAEVEGVALRGSFYLEVAEAAPAPSETWSVTKGTGYVFHSTSAPAHQNILLIADGFPGHPYEEVWKGLNDGGLWEPLRKQYTLVIMTYADGKARIQDNSAVVQALIRRALEKSPNDVSVMAISMGGLIARHAIAKTYQPDAPRRVAQYMSIDSPHRGAVIPLGLQIATSFFSAKSNDAKQSWELIRSPAAQQMLCFQAPAWDASGPSSIINPEFTKFFQELQSLGYPPGLKRMALSNGATVNTGSSFARAMNWSFSACEWLDLWLAGDAPQATPILKVRSDCTRGGTTVYTYNLTGSGVKEYAPGGLKNGIQQLSDGLPSSRTVWFGNTCFIPTVSSLDMDGDVLFDKVPLENRQTPFQGNYYVDKSTNTSHVFITPAMAQWIREKFALPSVAQRPAA